MDISPATCPRSPPPPRPCAPRSPSLGLRLRRRRDGTGCGGARTVELGGKVRGSVPHKRAVPTLGEKSIAAKLARDRLDDALRSRLLTRRTPNDWTPDEAAGRVDELRVQGHGPQRHEGQINSAQHDERVLRGIDPSTGRLEVHLSGRKAGQPKKRPPDSSSSFRSNEAYAQADAAARNSPELKAQQLAREETIYVRRLRLDEAIGSDYLRHVEGRTTIGDTESGTTRAAEFRDGEIFAKYQWNAATRRYDLVTMFPRGR